MDYLNRVVESSTAGFLCPHEVQESGRTERICVEKHVCVAKVGCPVQRGCLLRATLSINVADTVVQQASEVAEAANNTNDTKSHAHEQYGSAFHSCARCI